MATVKKIDGGYFVEERGIRGDDDGRPAILLIDKVGIKLKSKYSIFVSDDAETIILKKVKR